MEMPSLEEEATMREPFYGGEWDGDPDWYPADDEDEGWPYPDNDNPGDMPSVPTFHYVDDELYDRITEDDYPSEPEDWRHGEPAGDEGWSE